MLGTKTTKNEAKKKIDFKKPEKVEVTRAAELDTGVVMFDCIVDNMVRISGMSARPYTNKEGGEGVMINFPASKGKNGNYYDIAFFPIDSALKQSIIDQCNSLIG